jgi:hypothetical protein
MPEEIAGNLQRKVGGVNSRRYTIAERLVAQGGTIQQAAHIVKFTPEAVQAHMDKKMKADDVSPRSVSPPPPKKEGLPMHIIHQIGKNAGLSMDHYIGKVHTWENTDFLTFKDRNAPTGKSIYTLNLKTLRPTQTSPVQKQLNAELELALS